MEKKDKGKLTFDKILMQSDFTDLCTQKAFERDDTEKHEWDKALFIHRMLTSNKAKTYSDDTKELHINRLLMRIRAYERSTHRNNYWILTGIAASALILIALAVLWLKRDLWLLSDKHKPALELIVPSGEKSQLILADGTKVWVNSESRLTYPIRFKGRERKVMLEGEAYFDVAKAKDSEFIVFTQNVSVKVLGTKFNVKSYPKDRTIETTVVEGLVRVEDKVEQVRFSPIVLKSAERMIFQKDITKKGDVNTNDEIQHNTIQKSTPVPQNEITINHVNTENITCWKDHLLVFDNETLEEIALKMSRWYKVQVDILDPELKTYRYTGKFINNESLDQVLEAINLTTPIQYDIDQNSIQIRSKTKKQS
ncbi:MAG: FecR family protein [Bacteroidales bacterium]|nr:FecR family protein [Bacteroidales bacterium]